MKTKENIKRGIQSSFKKEPNKYLAQWLVDKKFFEKEKRRNHLKKNS